MRKNPVISITMSDLEELGFGQCCFWGLIGLALCLQAPVQVASLLGIEDAQRIVITEMRRVHVVWRVVYLLTHLFVGLMIVVIVSTIIVLAFRIMVHGAIAAAACMVFLVNVAIESAMKLFVISSAVMINWMTGMALSVLQILLSLISGPLQLVQEQYAQRQEIRRIYHDDHAAAFKTFRSFKRFWDAVERGDAPVYPGTETADEGSDPEQETRRDRPPEQKPDPYKQALDLFGLKEPFDLKAFKTRYREMMKAHHPDLTGDHHKAQDLNVAADIIKKKRRWK